MPIAPNRGTTFNALFNLMQGPLTIVETGTIEEVLSSPRHPYTMGLLSAVPRFDIRRPKLVPIPGQPPTAEDIVQGCAFSSRR